LCEELRAFIYPRLSSVAGEMFIGAEELFKRSEKKNETF
jgi:hypothetical protein